MHEELLTEERRAAAPMPAALRLGVCRVQHYKLYARLTEVLPDLDIAVRVMADPQQAVDAVFQGSLDALLWERWPFTDVQEDPAASPSGVSRPATPT